MDKLGKFIIHTIVVLSSLFLIFPCFSQPIQKSSDSPKQFLIDFEGMDLVAITQVEKVEYRWIILEDGDHVPVKLITCKMIENIRSPVDWPVGITRKVIHMDYTNLANAPIAPPPIIGRKFILWGSSTAYEDSSTTKIKADFWLHPQGLFLIRGRDEGQYVYWNKRAYLLEDIRQNEKKGLLIPLDQIKDPLKRIEVAQSRLEQDNLGDVNSFVEGLMLCLRNPKEQAQHVGKQIGAEPADEFFGSRDKASPFQLWYESLFLLKELGSNPTHKQKAVSALQPLVLEPDRNISLTVSIVLAEFGSGVGKKALIKNLNSEKIDLSQDPDGNMSFPGRMKYDDSSIAASAYSLGLLDDSRGLQNQNVEVKLAAADGLAEKHPNAQLIKELRRISRDLNKEFDQLLESGKLTEPRKKHDYTARLPKTWIKVHQLLARLGDNESLKHLVDAYKLDISTYPELEDSLTRQPVMSTWTTSTAAWPSLKRALYSSDNDRTKLLLRLTDLLKDDPAWGNAAFLSLRADLGEAIVNTSELKEKFGTKEDIEKRIAELLASPDPEKRAEGLSGAGFNQVEAYYQEVVTAAQEATGIEKRAAIYGLSFYEKEIPAKILMNLSSEGEFDTRLMGVELATRKNPAPYASIVIGLMQEVAERGDDSVDDMGDYEKSQNLTHMARILSRFSNTSIPPSVKEALQSPNPDVRLYVVRALGMGGNPESIALLNPLKNDSNTSVREEAEKALMFIGPEE